MLKSCFYICFHNEGAKSSYSCRKLQPYYWLTKEFQWYLGSITLLFTPLVNTSFRRGRLHTVAWLGGELDDALLLPRIPSVVLPCSLQWEALPRNVNSSLWTSSGIPLCNKTFLTLLTLWIIADAFEANIKAVMLKRQTNDYSWHISMFRCPK